MQPQISVRCCRKTRSRFRFKLLSRGDRVLPRLAIALGGGGLWRARWRGTVFRAVPCPTVFCPCIRCRHGWLPRRPVHTSPTSGLYARVCPETSALLRHGFSARASVLLVGVVAWVKSCAPVSRWPSVLSFAAGVLQTSGYVSVLVWADAANKAQYVKAYSGEARGCDNAKPWNTI